MMIKTDVFRTSASSRGLAARALITVLLLAGFFSAGAARADDAVTLSIETDASHTLGPGDSKALARKLAAFRARRAAAEQAAERFARQGLIQFVDRDRNELVHLVADRLNPDLLQDQCQAKGSAVTCKVRLRTVVRLSDFIDAQLASLRLSADEGEADYRNEMEPPVPIPLNPGQALAKAYRLIDKQEARMAIIYLDRLEHQYPNWREIYEVKAIALGLQKRPARMLEALRKACELGSPTACAEVK